MRAPWVLLFGLALPLELRAEPQSELQIASDPEAPPQIGSGPTAPDYSARPHRRGHFPEGLFVPVGFSVASASHPDSETALALGAEASVVAFPLGPGNWFGAYADLVHEGKHDRTRASLGLEFGFVLVGVDGGVVMQTSAAGTRWGGVVRPMLSLGLLHVYGRFGWLKDAEDFREIGVLFKFPIQVMDIEWNGVSPAPPAE